MQTETSQAYSPDFGADIRLFVASMRKLDSLPAVALKVIELAAGDEGSRRDIVQIIQSDGGLASQVIKVANSAWLGYGGRVATLDRAMALMGMEMVRNIALSVLVSDFFLKSEETGKLRVKDLWYHCLACAVAAEKTGRPCKMRYDRDDDMVITGIPALRKLSWPGCCTIWGKSCCCAGIITCTRSWRPMPRRSGCPCIGSRGLPWASTTPR